MEKFKINQDHTMMLQTCTPQPMSLPSINFLHIVISKLETAQDFKGQAHYGKVEDHDTEHQHRHKTD